MKKLLVLSAFALLASATIPNTQVQAKGGQIYLIDGCYYVVEHHSILWGLFEWDTQDLIGCGSGFN